MVKVLPIDSNGLEIRFLLPNQEHNDQLERVNKQGAKGTIALTWEEATEWWQKNFIKCSSEICNPDQILLE